MNQCSGYKTIIFDCDGVILDSNVIKLNGMAEALTSVGVVDDKLSECISYFANNFGKSRYHHVKVFENLVSDEDFCCSEVLNLYARYCDSNYSDAEVIPGVTALLENLTQNLYIASGSEESQLRQVIEKKRISHFFDGVYGSPMPKVEIVEMILKNSPEKAVLIGDSVADYEAAKSNSIDFIFFGPYSLCREYMLNLSKDGKFIYVDTMEELYENI